VTSPSDFGVLKNIHSCKRTAIYAAQAKVTKQHNTALNMNSKSVQP